MLWQPPLPDHYQQLTDTRVAEKINHRKQQLGDQLVILGHHYQQDDVIRHADFTGDSFKLSQLAAEKVKLTGAKFVIFCGVHFMAESADILTDDQVKVILPDLSAGCSMADMAQQEEVLDAWDQLQQLHSHAAGQYRIIPITYMNSSADTKAFCGANGGIVCTSSNAHHILQWALAGGDRPLAEGEKVKILFFPDQHLGRNTAVDLGYDIQTDMCLWDPENHKPLAGLDRQTLLQSTIILWAGHCSVHQMFRPEHVDQAIAEDPTVTVIVHPECEHQVVQRAHLSGSTEGIRRAVAEAPTGSSWAIGTEINMVKRLADQYPDKNIRILSRCMCLCTTMYRINPRNLLWVLDQLADGNVVNQINVDPETATHAATALQRMLFVTAKAQ